MCKSSFNYGCFLHHYPNALLGMRIFLTNAKILQSILFCFFALYFCLFFNHFANYRSLPASLWRSKIQAGLVEGTQQTGRPAVFSNTWCFEPRHFYFTSTGCHSALKERSDKKATKLTETSTKKVGQFIFTQI